MKIPKTVRREAVSNVTLKARYPNIDDPIRAINFALDALDDHYDRLDFLKTWREGNWRGLDEWFPEYLEFCK